MTNYPVVDRVTNAECKQLGRSGSQAVRARFTGEKRRPRKGEWYLSGAVVGAYRATNDLSTEFHIAELV